MVIAMALPGFNEPGRSLKPSFLSPSNSDLFETSFICAAVSNASWRVKFYLRNRPTSTK